METIGITKIHRQKRLAEILIIIGISCTLIATGAFVYVRHTALYVLLIVGLLFSFFGYANFAHLRENFKARLIAAWTATWVKNGDYEPRNGLSRNQIIRSRLFAPDATFETHDLISGALQGVAFISSDVRTTESKNATFHGRLFSFEFNHPFVHDFLHIPSDVFGLTEGFIKTKPHQQGYESYIPKQRTPMLSKQWVAPFQKLSKQHANNVSLSLIDSKLNLAINDHEDAFIMRLFKPLDLEKINAFQTDMRHLTALIKAFKSTKKNFASE